MKNELDLMKMYNDIENMIDEAQEKKENKPIILKNNEIKENNQDNIEEIKFDSASTNNTYDDSIILDNLNLPESIELDKNLSETNSDIFKKKVEDNIVDSKSFKEEDSNVNKDKDANKSKKSKKEKKKKVYKGPRKLFITSIILDVLAITCLFLMYGPISYFRNLWVTSAMNTMTHKYLAYIFFNQSQIDNILKNNTVIEGKHDTNADQIDFNTDEVTHYSSIYEEQVLKKDEGNELYKVIDIEGNGYKGHLLVIYDASTVKLKQTTNFNYGNTVEGFAREYGAIAGINAGGYSYSKRTGYLPNGVVIVDGKIICDNPFWGAGGIIGFNNDNVLVLTRASANEAINMGIRDAVSFGPFLIVNGIPAEFKGNGGYGVAPRTAIAQRKDGIVLMLVIDGRRPGHSIGVDMLELTNILINYGAYNAANLDGGGSSSLVVEGNQISVAGGFGYSGERILANSWLVIPNNN